MLSAPNTVSGWVGVTTSTFVVSPTSVTATSSQDVLPASLTINIPAGMAPGTYSFSVTAAPATACGQTGNAIGTGTLTIAAPTAVVAAISVSSSPNPSALNQSVTFTATASPANATGTVQFKDGATNLGAAVTLTVGDSPLASSAITVGPQPITIAYNHSNDLTTGMITRL